MRTYTSIPRGDVWDGGLEFYANVSDGDWGAWFRQFTEHRPVLPRVLYWLDIRFFGGHFVLPLVGGLIFLAGTWAMLLVIARAIVNERAKLFMIGATITLLLTSWMQIPNLAQGWNAPIEFMVMFFVLATLFTTALSKDNRFAFYIALVCGVAAAGTRANGLIALPLAAILAYLIGLRTSQVATALLVAVIVFVAYFSDYVRPDITGSPLAALSDPVGIAHYTLAYVGNIAFYIVFVAMAGVELAWALISGGPPSIGGLHDHPIVFEVAFAVAQMVGFGLVTVSAVIAWRWLRSDRDPLRGALIMFVIFVGGSAVGTALGRLSAFGIEQSIAARYTTSTLFALAALLILIARYLSLRQAWGADMSAQALGAAGSPVHQKFEASRSPRKCPA